MNAVFKPLLLTGLFFALYFASSFLDSRLAHGLVGACGALCPAHVPGEVPPALLISRCLVRIVLVTLVTLVVARLDGMPLRTFGWRPLAIGHMAFGMASGVAAIGVVVAVLVACDVVIVTGVHERGVPALAYALVWAVGMMLVGVSEEMAFRGAPLLLLGRVSPVAAVLVTALAFTLVHASNSGENWNGLVQIFLFGLVCAISVVRTGSLAWAIGFHAAWDCTLEYVFGAVGSGYVFQGHWLSQATQGPTWATGGAADLEGSVVTYLVLVVIGAATLAGRPLGAATRTAADAGVPLSRDPRT
jgi:uncharacterized protein